MSIPAEHPVCNTTGPKTEQFVMMILEIYDQYVSIQFLDDFHLIFSHLILRSPISLAVSLCSLIRCFAAPPIFI